MTTTTITTTPFVLLDENCDDLSDEEINLDEENLADENDQGSSALLMTSLASLRESMLEAYLLDENGQKQELSDEQLVTINQIIDRVVEVSTTCFEPFFNQLVSKLAEQLRQIEELEELLSRGSVAVSSSSSSSSKMTKVPATTVGQAPAAAPTAVAGKVSVPTLEWVAQNRKSGKTGDLTGFNIFTMAYSATFKAGRAPAGVWKDYDQKPWKVLATAFNSQYSTGKAKKASAATVVVSSAPATVLQAGSGVSSVSVAAPISAGAVEKPIKDGLTAYMYWSMQYHKEHGRRPTKGEWAKVPKAEVESLKVKLAALKAVRA